MKKLVLVFALLVCPPAWSALPDSYLAGPTWGTVVDAETNQPMGGALVIAIWELEDGPEWNPVGILEILESVTDEKGQFRMLGWGPIPRPANAALDSHDPLLVFYKPGYAKLGRTSARQSPPMSRLELTDRTFASNGDTTAMRKHDGSNQTSTFVLIQMNAQLSEVTLGRNPCRWKEVPHTIRMLQDEYDRLRASNPKIEGLFSAKLLMGMPQCAPIDDFLTKYKEPY